MVNHLTTILSPLADKMIHCLKNISSPFLGALFFATLLFYYGFWNLKKRESMKWLFKLNLPLQRFILFVIYLSLLLFFYWLFSTTTLGHWLFGLRRLILPSIDAGEADQQDKKYQKGQHREKSPADHQSQTSSSPQSSQRSKGKGLGSSSKKNKKKTSANDREASSSRDQRPPLSMQDVVNAGRDECRNMADQVKKLQIFDHKPKQQQRLPAVSHTDPGEKVQPMIANYEILGDSPGQAGTNFAKLFSSKGIKQTPDKNKSK